MNFRSKLFLFLLAGAFAALGIFFYGSFESKTEIISCDLRGCISESKLLANISDTLKANAVGYVAVVDNLFVAHDGWGRTSADPPTAGMTTVLTGNIASVTKTLTTIAVLQLLESKGLTVDSTMSPYLYGDWSKGTNIDQITFKQLLTHKSGFRDNCNGSNTTYAVLKSQISGGVATKDMGVGQYNNCNFAIFRELLPALSGNALDSLADGGARAQASADMYIQYMNKNVFSPVDVETKACKPPAGGFDILSYPLPVGSASGTDWGDWTLSCGGGGWVMSVYDVALIMYSLAYDNRLLADSEKSQMISNCLGWDCSVRSDCPDPYVCKNGGLDDVSKGVERAVWTYAGLLTCNVPVVVYVNSPLPSPWQTGQDIIGLVANSLKNAAVPRPVLPLPSGQELRSCIPIPPRPRPPLPR
jgi:hypothetical protein